MKRNIVLIIALMASITAMTQRSSFAGDHSLPNIIIIYADDLGYGDISCYGAKAITTSHINRLAKEGILFTNAHATAATCTPSRYSMLTGKYAWRKKGTGIARGNAALLIDTAAFTLQKMLQQKGYITAAVGKWHLGLGPLGGPDWNGKIFPSANETGFNYSFIIPATPDRVPCVYVQNHAVVNLDPSDPITVSYEHPVGDGPTGKDHPELLLLKSSPGQGHDQTIVNGIGRIGYMAGGRSALWNDSLMSKVLCGRALDFINENKNNPFFLYFASHDIHVPRVAGKDFSGKSIMGARGDEILELDGETGRILHLLDSLHLSSNTMIIFTSDNGPVLDDGYDDDAVTGASRGLEQKALLTTVRDTNSIPLHRPAGPFRGGKYSIFEGGTRVPFIVYWPGKISPGVSGALISQADLLASFAHLGKHTGDNNEDTDSQDIWPALTGQSRRGRESLIEEGAAMAIIEGNWKYIEPHDGPPVYAGVNIESGLSSQPQLYDLAKDKGEKINLAARHPAIVKKMAGELAAAKQKYIY